MNTSPAITSQHKVAPSNNKSQTDKSRDELERLYRQARGYLYGSKKTRKDVPKAVQLLEQAAQAGHVQSSYLLAECYYDQLGSASDIPNDHARAAQLFAQAAEGGNVDAIFRLGVCYYCGNGVKQNPERAVQLFTRGVEEHHHRDCIRSLGNAYIYGHGTGRQDFDRGFSLIHEAAMDMKDVLALSYLAWAYLCGHGTPVSVPTAIQCLRAAIQRKEWNAVFLLANIQAASQDAKDLLEARELSLSVPQHNRWFQQAAWLRLFIDEQINLLEQLQSHKVTSDPLPPDFFMDADIQLVAYIGAGHFGRVFLARLKQQKWVVVKFMKVDLIQTDEDAVRKILRERFTCRVVANGTIPNVVRYLGFMDDLGHRLRGLVFDFCGDVSKVASQMVEIVENSNSRFVSSYWQDIEALPDWSKLVKTSLRSALVFAERRPWPLRKVIGILREMAVALDQIHKRGYLHRDIAPRNVLCDGKGNVQLADFGLTKFVGCEGSDDQIHTYYKHLTEGHQYALAWWAPECLAVDGSIGKAEFSTDSDVYSFAVLMWQCFAHHDPFDDVSDPGQIVTKILDGHRPDLAQVDRDTPSELIELIQDCWQTDPDERPCLDTIVEVLTAIEGQETPRKRMRVRSSRDQVKRWFEISEMYRTLSLNMLEERASKSTSGAGSFVYHRFLNMLATVRHEKSVVEYLTPENLICLKSCPFDVFLIHSGAQKRTEVATMKDYFEGGALRCFFDLDMVPGDGAPVNQMRFALETCRHAVVLLSRAFLEKRSPCNELAYAFQRMEWLRRYEYWESLWVVLFDITVSEYNQARRERPELPDLGSQITVLQWHSGMGTFESWPQLCHRVKALIIRHDKTGATDSWLSFLNGWPELDPTFPRAHDLYSC